ncbi:hypothetical protein FRC01_007763 [Tulasnella sp. 417]|nr:hypothetical protein FRC01_007763 [Tulasnella sp. 417]
MTHSDEDPLNVPHPSGLLDLPIELFKQVISYLPVYSQARFICPICEECMYKKILLAVEPRRSLRLLETFVRRPDLALLVHYISINTGQIKEYAGSSLSLGGHDFDGAAALSLAKNLHYLQIWGPVYWLREQGYDRLRRVIFNMKLRGLILPDNILWTLWNDLRASWDLKERSEDMVHDIRSLLQAQPRLEYLSLIDCILSDEVLSILKARLLPSDVPSLKSLEADQNVAIAFMAAAPGLESLRLSTTGEWDHTIFSQLESSSFKSQFLLRRLAITAWSPDAWLLENLARIFALFPRMEALTVWIWASSEVDLRICYI